MLIIHKLVDECEGMIRGLLRMTKLENDFVAIQERFEKRVRSMTTAELHELVVDYLILQGYTVGEEIEYSGCECINVSFSSPDRHLTIHGLAVQLFSNAPDFSSLYSFLSSDSTYKFSIVLTPLVTLSDLPYLGEYVSVDDLQRILQVFVCLMTDRYLDRYLYSLPGLGLRGRLLAILSERFDLNWEQVKRVTQNYKQT